MPKRKYGMILVSLSVALVLAMIAGTSLGALGFQPGLVLQALSAPSDPANALVISVRLPRTLVAAMVGASLAVASFLTASRKGDILIPFRVRLLASYVPRLVAS